MSSPPASPTQEYNDWVEAQENFDWGKAALEKLDEWKADMGKFVRQYPLDWTRRVEGNGNSEELAAT